VKDRLKHPFWQAIVILILAYVFFKFRDWLPAFPARREERARTRERAAPVHVVRVRRRAALRQ